MEAEGWGQTSIREAVATLGLSPTTSQTVSSIQQVLIFVNLELHFNLGIRRGTSGMR